MCIGAALALSLAAACDSGDKKLQLPASQQPVAGEGDRAGSATAPAAAGLAGAAAGTASVDGQAGADPPVPRPAAASSEGQPTFFTGTLEPLRRSMLMPRGSGGVSRVDASEGDMVKRGQVLVVLDTSTARVQLQQAEAARNLAQAQIDAVRVEWRRLQGLVKARAVPRGEFEKVDAQLKVALAGLQQAEAALALGRKMIADTVTRAPFDGVITKSMVEVGQWVSTMPPTQLMLLEQIDRLKLRVQVPETAIGKVQVGTPLEVRLSASGHTLRARVSQVVRSLNPHTRSFSVFAELDNRDLQLRPGMFAEVYVTGAAPPSSRGAEGGAAAAGAATERGR